MDLKYQGGLEKENFLDYKYSMTLLQFSEVKSQILTYLKKNKLDFSVISAVFIIATLLRFWNIPNYMTFLGDEGRDALVLLNIFQDGKLTLLGPSASVGGFFLGPAYYYLVIPGFLLFGMSPVGMSFEVAVLGLFSVIVFFWLTKKYLGFIPAISATFLYAVSPLIVTFSRSSWNPNIMPLLSISILSCLLLAQEKQKIWLNFIVGGLFGLAIQSHYLGLILALPILIVTTVFWSRNLVKLIKVYLLTLLGFFITFSPFLLFELRHGFQNTTTIIEFISKPSSAVGVRELQYSENVISALSRLFKEVLSISSKDYAVVVTIFIFIFSILSIIKLTNRKQKNYYFTVLVWIISGVAGIGLYNGELYNYYFAFLFPLPFLLISLIYFVFSQTKIGKYFVLFLTIIFSIYLLPKNIIFQPQSNQLKTAETVADKVIELADGKEYNFALMARGNTDYAYRFFLESKNKPPLPIEQKITDQLIVVCEDKDCRYNLSPLPQILSFGPRKLDQEVDFIPGHIKIFRLVHESSK